MRMYAVSNQVVMVFNDGNSRITNSDDVKLKAGVNYAPSEWTYIAFISLEPNKVIELYSDYTPSQQ